MYIYTYTYTYMYMYVGMHACISQRPEPRQCLFRTYATHSLQVAVLKQAVCELFVTL